MYIEAHSEQVLLLSIIGKLEHKFGQACFILSGVQDLSESKWF